MKTINRFSIILAVLFLSLISTSCEDKIKSIGHIVNGNTHTITLNVNTKIVTNKNLCKTSNFGQADSISNEDYTIMVHAGDSIIWQAVSSTAPTTDEVYITMIKFKKGKMFFKNKELTGRKKVRGKVKEKDIKKGDSMKYIIKFTVIKKGSKSNKKFEIDPKLRMTY